MILDASNILKHDKAKNIPMLSLMKQSHEINSLPPTKPFVFSGFVIECPRWRSMFDLMVDSKDYHRHQKLVYLDAVQSGLNVLSTPDAYIEARNIRDDIYSDPYEIVDAYIDKLEKWSQMDVDNSK